MRYARGLSAVAATILLCLISTIAGEIHAVPPVILQGEDGGMVNGREWDSADLKDKLNLLMYVSPHRKSWVNPLVHKLDSIGYSTDTVGVTYIMNTYATLIPDFVIKAMIKHRAGSDTGAVYVLDRNKILIKKWGLKEDSVNVLLFDSSGKVIFTFNGEITEEHLKVIIKRIDESIRLYRITITQGGSK